MLKDKLQRVKLADLNPAPYNPKIPLDPTKERLLKQSLGHYGYIENIVVNDRPWKKEKDLTIIDGHSRVKQLIKDGIEIEDVVVLSLSEDEEKALNLALEEIRGNPDPGLQLKIIEDLSLKGFDVELAGFDDVKLQELSTEIKPEKKEVKEDDFDPESVEESICQLGDVWQLGNHKLMCGDSTNKENITQLLNNEKIDMVFTDPPYDFDNDKSIPEIINLATSNSHIFIMHDDKGIINYLRNSNFDFKRFFILDTNIASPRGNDPYLRHILVSHEQKGTPIKHQNMHDGLSSIIKIEYRKNIKEERLHPHQKTVKDISKFITHYSQRKQKVLDIFGGSGSTLIACEQLQRQCYMMELEPSNCDIIIKRWEDFTGEKANKIS